MSHNIQSDTRWSAPISTTIEHVKWAQEIFSHGEALTAEQLVELATTYKTTRALREYYMSRPDFRARYGVLVRQLLQESIRYKKESLRKSEAELASIQATVEAFAKQTDMAIRDIVRVLEAVAVINKAGEDLRTVTRKQRALSRDLAEQRHRIEELGKSVVYLSLDNSEISKRHD